MQSKRSIVWFSCGVASAITALIVRQQYPDAQLVRIWIGGEDEDGDRFASDIAAWLKCEIVVLKSEKYRDHWQVIEKTGWVNGVAGARCTAELKKAVRHKFQQVDDVQYFGYTADSRDQRRAQRFRLNFPEVEARFPLIENGLTKENCAGMLLKAGIELPRMYREGFNNNNCVGCVKGGKGYWNKIRLQRPEVFERMARLERKVGASCIKGAYLDELQEGEGNHKDFEIACDFMCDQATVELTKR